ncbi:MAG: LytR family transcriptional regulator [Ruminococcaceae bacterium]|nr:LytR family transcriptional regulator [Oscillospiraceae bacterium]
MKRLQKESARGKAAGQHPRTRADLFGTAAMILLLAVSLVLFIRLMASRLLTTKYLLLIMAALLVLNAAHVFVQYPLRRNKLGKLICGGVAVVLSAGMLWAMVGVGSVQSAISRITGKTVETNVIAVVVRDEDPARELADTAGYIFGYVEDLDRENIDSTLEHIGKELGGAVDTRSSDGLAALVDDLYDGSVGAIVVNTGLFSGLEEQEGYADLSERTRVIYEYTITREVVVPPNDASVTEPFVVYCSGIDARSSDITARGNGDVNILAVVNPSTHEILLLNTPRDYYVALHMNGRMDKLTHAAVYGIDESMNTLDDLYGIDTPYYIRVNFNGLVDIVDAVGGVDVESPKAFTTRVMQIPNGDGTGYDRRAFSFPAGTIHLTGREALAFSRERYAFADGDNQRGKNQMAVIKGIVNKIISPSILSNYQSLLKAVSGSMLTNISYDEVTALVQAQQRDMRGWHVTSYAVSGTPASDYCYSYSGIPLYVTRQDPSSVETARELIRQVLDGETPVVP